MVPNVDSIGEFKVLRSLYPAESGRSGGGQVNIVTRSGGSGFRGSAFEFLRNEIFNANNFLINASANPAYGRDGDGKARRPPYTQQRWFNTSCFQTNPPNTATGLPKRLAASGSGAHSEASCARSHSSISRRRSCRLSAARLYSSRGSRPVTSPYHAG